MDSCFDLVGARQNGVAAAGSWSIAAILCDSVIAFTNDTANHHYYTL